MRRQETGFTLTEVLVAMGLLAVGMAGVLSLYSAAVTLQRESAERMDVAMLLPGVMAEVREELNRRAAGKEGRTEMKGLEGVELPVRGNPRYRYRVTLEDDPTDSTGMVVLCRVELIARARGSSRAYDFGYLPIILERDNDDRIRELLGQLEVRTMRSFSRIMLGALVLMLVTGGLRADDLVLVDGRYLQVKFLKGEERGVQVKLLDTGGEILIPWNLIREGDRERLMRMFGLIEDASDIPMEKGVRIIAKSGDIFLGVPLTEIPKGQIPDEITLWIEGRKTPFKKEHIRSLEPTMVPSMEAFSRQQLYDRQFSQFPPGDDDLEGHWDLSRYCVSISFYEKALEHLHKVAELDSQYRPDYVANQIMRLEELRKSEKIMEQLRQALRKAFHNQFSVALSTIDQLLSIKDMDPNIQMEIEMKQTKIQAMRLKYYTRVVTRNYHRLLELKLRKMSADKNLKLNQAKRELRRNVHKEIVADISSAHGLDQKEVQNMWKERKAFSFRTASYGSGTFIVLGKKKGMERLNQQVENAIRRAQGRQQGRGGKGNQNSFNNTMQRLPKPPTPDEWWRKTDASSRKNWMKAYYAENAGQMKDISERKAGCGSCGSTGTRKFSGAQGETLKVTCPRCAGHKHDRRVAYK